MLTPPPPPDDNWTISDNYLFFKAEQVVGVMLYIEGIELMIEPGSYQEYVYKNTGLEIYVGTESTSGKNVMGNVKDIAAYTWIASEKTPSSTTE